MAFSFSIIGTIFWKPLDEEKLKASEGWSWGVALVEFIDIWLSYVISFRWQQYKVFVMSSIYWCLTVMDVIIVNVWYMPFAPYLSVRPLLYLVYYYFVLVHF